jgi:hypothetical protein
MKLLYPLIFAVLIVPATRANDEPDVFMPFWRFVSDEANFRCTGELPNKALTVSIFQKALNSKEDKACVKEEKSRLTRLSEKFPQAFEGKDFNPTAAGISRDDWRASVAMAEALASGGMTEQATGTPVVVASEELAPKPFIATSNTGTHSTQINVVDPGAIVASSGALGEAFAPVDAKPFLYKVKDLSPDLTYEQSLALISATGGEVISESVSDSRMYIVASFPSGALTVGGNSVSHFRLGAGVDVDSDADFNKVSWDYVKVNARLVIQFHGEYSSPDMAEMREGLEKKFGKSHYPPNTMGSNKTIASWITKGPKFSYDSLPTTSAPYNEKHSLAVGNSGFSEFEVRGKGPWFQIVMERSYSSRIKLKKETEVDANDF